MDRLRNGLRGRRCGRLLRWGGDSFIAVLSQDLQSTFHVPLNSLDIAVDIDFSPLSISLEIFPQTT